ncbi:MAG: hypothetical protein ABR927_14980 [Bacteroidales bacterium]|jgi:hypothetical protein
MKKLHLVFSISIFLSASTIGLQAQTTQNQLNQVELMKQFIGSWKTTFGNERTFFWEAKSYGTGFETNLLGVDNGNTMFEGKQLLGYDKKNDKYIVAQMFQGKDIEIGATWFISNTKYKWIPNCDISYPEKALIINEGEFKSPDMFVETKTVNNNPIQTLTYTRIK